MISRVTSRITVLTTYIRGLMTPLTITHWPPSNPIPWFKDENLVIELRGKAPTKKCTKP